MILSVISGAPPPSAGGAEPFDLSPYTNLAWTPVWPTAPTTTSSQAVTPANISSHINATKSLTLGGGSYGSLSVTGNDQAFILQSGAVVQDFALGSGVSRIVIRGENPRDGTIRSIRGTSGTVNDILINGVTMNANATAGQHLAGSVALVPYDGARWAIVNSFVESVDYSIYSFSGTAGGGITNLIVANNNFQANSSGSASGVRLGSSEHLIYVRNRLQNRANGQHFRLHSGWSPTAGQAITGAYIGYNQFEYLITTGFSTHNITPLANGGDDGASMAGVIFEENTTYRDTGDGPIAFGSGTPPSTPNELLIRNNVVYGASAWPSGTSYVTLTGNTRSAYTSPPSWSYA